MNTAGLIFSFDQNGKRTPAALEGRAPSGSTKAKGARSADPLRRARWGMLGFGALGVGTNRTGLPVSAFHGTDQIAQVEVAVAHWIGTA